MNAPVEDGENKRKPLSLRRNFSWTFIGNTVYAAAQWGMLVVLARLSSADVVGQFRLALGLTAPIILFTNLQLRGVQATDAKEQYTPQMYLALRIVMTLLGLAGILLVALTGYADRQELILVICWWGWQKALRQSAMCCMAISSITNAWNTLPNR
jgi:O-antigen/teichoic acid export membrane protein